MAVRKCLLLTYHFPPSGAVAVHRMLGLVRYLPRFGWQPIVVAPPRVPWEPEDASLLAQVPADTIVERVPFATGPLGKLARWAAPEAHWLFKANRAARRLIRQHRPDAILTTSPPGLIHLLGLWLKRRTGLPWLACFRDPWVTNHPIPRWTLGLRCERWLEAQVMRHASALIANTPGNQRGWSAAYPEAAARIVTIPNGYDPERFPDIDRPALAEGPVTILHAGELYHRRDPRPLLDALQSLSPAVRVEFLGRKTEAVYDFPTEIERRGLGDRVLLEGQAPYAEAIGRMQRADILMLIHTPEYRVGIPAKLYEYLGARRPILALAEPDSDIAWILSAAGVLHRIAPPLDVRQIRQALSELVEAVRSGQAAVRDPAKLHDFTREQMARRMAECLDRCAGGAPVGGAP